MLSFVLRVEEQTYQLKCFLVTSEHHTQLGGLCSGSLPPFSFLVREGTEIGREFWAI
jgi:hypothetical protein